jgi:hypothetical protein
MVIVLSNVGSKQKSRVQRNSERSCVAHNALRYTKVKELICLK